MIEETGLLDFSTLNELREILEEGLEELLAEYLADTLTQLQQLRAAAVRGDVDAIAAVAHRLKGSSGNLGVSGLYRLCAALEAEVREGRQSDLPGAVAGIEAEFERAKQALQCFMAG